MTPGAEAEGEERGRDGAPALLVMRHAEAGGAACDAERPLTGRGREEAARVAARVAALLPQPLDLVLCSSALRTRQTLDAVRAAWPAPPAEVAVEHGLYLAPAERLLARLWELDEAVRRVLVVAHLPGVEDLVRELAGDGAALREALRPGFGPATLAWLIPTRPWSALGPGGVRFAGIARPRDPAPPA